MYIALYHTNDNRIDRWDTPNVLVEVTEDLTEGQIISKLNQIREGELAKQFLNRESNAELPMETAQSDRTDRFRIARIEFIA